MRRKSGHVVPDRRSASLTVRLGVALATWIAVASVAQVVVGAEIGQAVRRMDERIELRLKGLPQPDTKQPERTHEITIDPWELMSV